VVIIGREIAVSGLRSIATAEGYVLEPSELGKTKMVFQVVAITVLILAGRRYPALRPLAEVLLWMVVLFAVASAVQYFWSFWQRLDVRVKQRSSRRLIVIRAGEKKPEEKDVAAQ
jgi:CDP-diacylglycerol--glycerol-3-phosphate 3-phosphatidyltransferase